MFGKFVKVELETDRFPTKTIKCSGFLAALCNYGVVPLFQLVPKSVIKPFGFHIIVKAVK